MKHLFTLLSFYLLSTNFSSGQNWALPSSRWIYETGFCGSSSPCTSNGHYYLEVQKDTIIESISCRKITGGPKTIYTYDSGDTVYVYMNGGFHSYYYFNVQAGDTIQLYNDTLGINIPNATVKILAVVDSITTATYQNVSLKSFHVTTITGVMRSRHFTYQERSGIYSRYGILIYTDLYYGNIDSYKKICTYGDSTITNYWIFNQYLRCDISNGIQDMSTGSSFTLSPNPASDHIEISTELKDYKIEVLDMMGRSFDCAIKENTIDIRILADGVYMLLLTADGVSVNKRFVKQ